MSNAPEEDKFARLVADLTPDHLVDLLQYARVLLAYQQAQRTAPTAYRWAGMTQAAKQKIVKRISGKQ